MLRGLVVAIDLRQDLILCRLESRCGVGLCGQKKIPFKKGQSTKKNISILPRTKIYTMTFNFVFPFKCHKFAVQIWSVYPLYDITPSDIYYCIFIYRLY